MTTRKLNLDDRTHGTFYRRRIGWAWQKQWNKCRLWRPRRCALLINDVASPTKEQAGLNSMPASDLRYCRSSLLGLRKDRALLLARPGPPRARDHDVRRIRPRSRHGADIVPISTIPIQLYPSHRKAPVTERLHYSYDEDG